MSSRRDKKPRAAGDSSRSGPGGRTHPHTAKRSSRDQTKSTADYFESETGSTHSDRVSGGNQRTRKAPNRAAPSRPPAQSGGPSHGKKPPMQSGGHNRTAPSKPPDQGGRRVKQSSKVASDVAQKKSEKSLRRSVSPRKEQYSHLLDESVGRGDMVLLEPLTEEGVIENLKLRYKAGEIYVSAVWTLYTFIAKEL